MEFSKLLLVLSLLLDIFGGGSSEGQVALEEQHIPSCITGLKAISLNICELRNSKEDSELTFIWRSNKFQMISNTSALFSQKLESTNDLILQTLALRAAVKPVYMFGFEAFPTKNTDLMELFS